VNVKRVGPYIETSEILRIYYNEIRNCEVLTREREVELFKQMKEGNMDARREIIEHNQKFVVSVAKKFCSNDNLPDLINEGMIGMMTAIDKFDLDRGVKFISFAVHYIHASIQAYITGMEMTVSKTNGLKTDNVVKKAHRMFIKENGREPNDVELENYIAEHYEYNVRETRDIYKVNVESLANLDSSEWDDDGRGSPQCKNFNEHYSSCNLVEFSIQTDYNRKMVEKLMGILTPIEFEIVKLSYGIDVWRNYNNQEIANILGLSTERVRQIIETSLDVMKVYYQEYHNEIIEEVG
jgi:RNA polymerase sigma factor (sigma-70 family)